MHVIPQTRDEKIAIYMKLTKRELAEMLATANEAMDALTRQPEQWQIVRPQQTYTPPAPMVTTTWRQPNTCVGPQ